MFNIANEIQKNHKPINITIVKLTDNMKNIRSIFKGTRGKVNMNLVVLDGSYEKTLYMTGLGVNTSKTGSYYIEDTSKAAMEEGMSPAVYKTLIGTLKRKGIQPPYAFVTWGGPDKQYILQADGGTEFDLKCGGVVIDIEPLFHTMTINSSLGKLARRLGCGTKLKRQQAENHAVMIMRIIDEVNKLSSELKYVLDPVRLSIPEYLNDFKTLTNILIQYGILNPASIEWLLDEKPDSRLQGKDLEVWYREYKRGLLEEEYTATLNSRLHQAQLLYKQTGRILRSINEDLNVEVSNMVAETEVLRERALEDLKDKRFKTLPKNAKGYYMKKKEVIV